MNKFSRTPLNPESGKINLSDSANMKIPSWKKYLSYLTELHVESTTSPYNKELHVSISDGRYMLSTENAIYSYADKYDNFLESFEAMKLNEGIQNVLLLGFGLGSIPYMLEKKLGYSFHYTGVEIDEEVIYLASKYVLDDLKSDVQLICSDAMSFLVQSHEKFDLICMDVFESDVIPEQFETPDFLQLMKENLTENGKIMYNRLAYTGIDTQQSKQYYETVFLQEFPDAAYLEIKGNWMLFNDKSILKHYP